MKLLNLNTPREIPPVVFYARCQGLLDLSLNIPVHEARDFHCCSHVLLTWRKGPYQSEHEAVGVIIRKLAVLVHLGANVSRVGCPNIPTSVLFQSGFTTITRHRGDPFDPLADIQCAFEKAERQTRSHARHLTAWESRC